MKSQPPAIALLVMVLLLLCSSLAFSQNTKGDRPSNNREGRFKTPVKSTKKRKASSNKRIKAKDRSQANRGAEYRPRGTRSGKERPGKPIRPVFSKGSEERKQKAWRGDLTGRRIRTKNKSSSGSARNVYTQRGKYVNNRSVSEKSIRAISSGPRSRTNVRSRTGKTKNVFSQRSRYVRNYSDTKPSRAWRGDLTGRRLRTKNYSSTNKNRNVYQQRGPYVRKSVSEQRPSKNIGGGGVGQQRTRTGRTNNVFPQNGKYTHNPYSRPRSTEHAVSNRSTLSRLNKLQGDPNKKPSSRKTKVVPASASRPFLARKSINVYANFRRPKHRGERASTKDLAGRPLRARNYETPRPGVIAPTFKPYAGRKRVGDRPYGGPSQSYRSRTKKGEWAWRGDVARRGIRHRDKSSKRSVEGTPILSRRPRSASQLGSQRPGSALPPKAPGAGALSLRKYQGNIKGRRGQKGGGSVSGNLWNNNNSAIAGKQPGAGAQKIGSYSGNIKAYGRKSFRDQGKEFTGTIKARRPERGGGSVSGRLWNNNGSAIAGRVPSSTARRMGSYSGNIKSYGKKSFRDQGEGFTGNIKTYGKKSFRDQGEEFTGTIKAHRPEKGGGSVSGKLWNNNGTAVVGRGPSATDRRMGNYTGNIRSYGWKSFKDQGEGFTGTIKAKKPEKGGGSVSGKLWNNNETPIAVRTPPDRARKEGEYSGELKLARFKKYYVQNDAAANESIKKRKPSKNNALVNGLQVKVKQYNYKRNPSSVTDALKVREPGKAFARATDYQGNIKMQKFSLFERKHGLHPDAQFVKTNKNNVDEERDMLTNFKLWWARLFKKQDTQPSHLKDKGHKPRYDKGEQGLWYD